MFLERSLEPDGELHLTLSERGHYAVSLPYQILDAGWTEGPKAAHGG